MTKPPASSVLPSGAGCAGVSPSATSTSSTTSVVSVASSALAGELLAAFLAVVLAAAVLLVAAVFLAALLGAADFAAVLVVADFAVSAFLPSTGFAADLALLAGVALAVLDAARLVVLLVVEAGALADTVRLVDVAGTARRPSPASLSAGGFDAEVTSNLPSRGGAVWAPRDTAGRRRPSCWGWSGPRGLGSMFA